MLKRVQHDKKKDYLPPFSILAFNSARISLLSPKVDVCAGAEAVSVAALTFFSSSSLKIAVWDATTLLNSLLNSITSVTIS